MSGMQRQHLNRKGSHRAFNSRAHKTHKVNNRQVLRGGIRL